MDRRWRLVWVLLLCVLLPLRGALAASMACAGQALPTPAVAAPPSEHPDGCPHGHDLTPAQPSAHATVHAPLADAAADADAPESAWQHPSCHLCVAGCLWLPLPAGSADWRPEPAAGGTHFPPPSLPAIAWVADGPDRPPKG